mgnify:CR=1 FL=1
MGNSVKVYGRLLVMFQQLEVEEQLHLLEDLVAMVKGQTLRKKHDILELKGLGKELWGNIDAQEYLDSERNAWSG